MPRRINRCRDLASTWTLFIDEVILELSMLRIEVELHHGEFQTMYTHKEATRRSQLFSLRFCLQTRKRKWAAFRGHNAELWDIVTSRPWMLACNFDSLSFIYLTILSVHVIHLQTDFYATTRIVMISRSTIITLVLRYMRREFFSR